MKDSYREPKIDVHLFNLDSNILDASATGVENEAFSSSGNVYTDWE